MDKSKIKEEIINLINSHTSIINQEQSFRKYVSKCQRENKNNEESIVQPFTISFLRLLNYHNQQNLTIEEESEGNKPDFHTSKFILECKSTKYKDFSDSMGREETPLEQLKRYLKSKEFKRDYGILFSLDRFEVYVLKDSNMIMIDDLSFSLINTFENLRTNIDNFIEKFYVSPLSTKEKIDIIINTDRSKLLGIRAKEFNKIIKSLKNQVSLALVENYKKLEHNSDEKLLIKNKICDIKKQLDISQDSAQEEYISQTAFIYLARLILTKCWEDLEIIDPPNTYNGGFKIYFDNFKGKINDLFQMAINKAQDLYYLFDRSNPYLLIELPDELIIDILLEFCKYDFRSLSQDILGYVYEDYLDRENRRKFGQYYTPPYIVNLILDRVGYIPRANILLDRTILDPASGSGSFLLNAVKRVLLSKTDGQDNSMDYKNILENSIYGSELMLFPYLLSEINILLQFSVVIKKLLSKDKKLNVSNIFPNNSFNLIDKKFGSRLFNLTEDTILGDQIIDPALTERKKIKLEKFKQKNDFHFVVGNPPYVSNDTNPELFQELKNKFTFCNKTYSNKMDLFYWFVILGILKLKPGGKLCYITTRYWMSKGQHTGVESLKECILEYCYVREIIDLQNVNVFRSARGQENVIFLLERKSEENKDANIKIIEINSRPQKEECQLENCAFPDGYCKNDEDFLTCICQQNESWDELIKEPRLSLGQHIKAYISAKKTSDLKKNRSWDIFYEEGGTVDTIITEIEQSCTRTIEKEFAGGIKSQKTIKTHIGDYFQIRYGITTIADDIFILNDNNLCEKANHSFLKIESTRDKNLSQKQKLIKEYKDILFKVNKPKETIITENDFNQGGFYFYDNEGVLWLRISNRGLKRLKNNYKTPAIYRHGLNLNECVGKMIFFNKEAEVHKCPAIFIYLQQYREILTEKLKGYKEWTSERPYKWVTLRRAGSSKLWDESRQKNVDTDLEEYYDSKPKIFFNYIMKTDNIFGFYDGPLVGASDLYFFHPSKKKIKLSYILAYLNSKVMTFFFANRPIYIKRAKANIENDVPVFIPRNENEKILYSYISKIEQKIVRKLKDLETTKRLQGFNYNLELADIGEIKVNYEKFVRHNNINLPTLDDLSYKLTGDGETAEIDRNSFPIIVRDIKTVNFMNKFRIEDTETDRIFQNKSFKLYCVRDKAEMLEQIIDNFRFFKEKRFRPSEILGLHFISEKEFNDIFSAKEEIYNSLKRLEPDEKLRIEEIIGDVLNYGENNKIENLDEINEFLYFIDYAFIQMMVPNNKNHILKNF